MANRRNLSRELVPADVLLLLRDRADSSFDDLRAALGIHKSPSDQRNGRLIEILRALSAVGVMEFVQGASPTRDDGLDDDLPLSDWIDPSRRYRVMPLLRDLQLALGLSFTDLRDAAARPHRDDREELEALADQLESRLPACGYKTDLVHSIREVSLCLEARCYVATLALSGKILEIAIKHDLEQSGREFQDDWMLGTLLRKLDDGPSYVDPGLKNVANIINASRIPAVHAKRDVPIPSPDQAALVVRATLDVVRRLVVARLEKG